MQDMWISALGSITEKLLTPIVIVVVGIITGNFFRLLEKDVQKSNETKKMVKKVSLHITIFILLAVAVIFAIIFSMWRQI